MLLIQALVELARRSIGRVFQSIFGWSVYVLFGVVGKEERTILAAAVAGAAFWPVLAAGAVLPRVAAFVLAFVPLPESVPAGLLRAVWIVLAVAIPLFVGWVVQRRSAGGYSARRVLSGFPITLGIAAAFLVALFVVPVQKLAALLRGERTELVPLVAERQDSDSVSRALRATLSSAGIDLTPRETPRLQRVISGILRSTSVAAGQGDAAPSRYFEGERLALTIHPNGIDLRGRPADVLRAHALIAERAVELPALQTTDPEAQELERRIRSAWPRRGEGPRRGPSRELRALARELSVLDCPYDEWEVVCRELLQLHLAVSGEPQLLAGALGAATSRDDPSRLARRQRRAAEEARVGGFRALGKTAEAVAGLARRLPAEAYRLWRRR